MLLQENFKIYISAFIAKCSCLYFEYSIPLLHTFSLKRNEMVKNIISKPRCFLTQELMDNSEPFGGVSVVLSGDFKQTLSIIRRANQFSQIHACLKSDDMIWSIFEDNRYYLTENMRLKKEDCGKERRICFKFS